MVWKTLLALALGSVVGVAWISIGHEREHSRRAPSRKSAEATGPSVVDASPGQSPSVPEASGRQYAHRLPGMECLVNQFGIRRKVIVTRRGVHCTDRAPGGATVGAQPKFFMPHFVFERCSNPRRGRVLPDRPDAAESSVLGWVSAADAAAWDTRVGGASPAE